ncbi:hypothetical protein [Roseivirga sp. E12]|uniref:hypothetical protein n=1 Tax=Roseivirga sp. E12 TaxID=2819237 RepID=UPI001ABCDC38|nr:hypothetical protein [Roseivirga sp. E12]MBO3697279.1 hypothetical protein [Roseivirga sp. E12]
MFSKLRKLILNPNKYLYKLLRNKYTESPYPIEYYRDLLEMLTNENVFFQPFMQIESSKERINVFVRHDIDRQECIDNLEDMVALNKEYKIQSGLFFLVNDRTYNLSDYRDKILAYREDGLEIGLHTECYRFDDYMKEFKRETDRFEKVLGFRPQSFTVHGLGYRNDVRGQFYSVLDRNFKSTGYSFSDCISKFRSYDYVMEDCHKNSKTQKRFIYSDFQKLPSFLKPGENLLVLTHPCYWKV